MNERRIDEDDLFRIASILQGGGEVRRSKRWRIGRDSRGIEREQFDNSICRDGHKKGFVRIDSDRIKWDKRISRLAELISSN